jgi:hypothetical protein
VILAGLLNAPFFVAFTKADIAFVYASIWKQRNFTPVITEKYGIPNPCISCHTARNPTSGYRAGWHVGFHFDIWSEQWRECDQENLSS